MSENFEIIAQNPKARHDYHIETSFETGVALQGWEVKALRKNRAQLKESYVIIRSEEAWLLGMHISPLSSTSTHIKTDPTRTRKLLLHTKEIQKLIGQTKQKGYTLVPLRLYFKRQWVKLEVGLAKGKKDYDKRDSEKNRDWQRTQQRLLRDKG